MRSTAAWVSGALSLLVCAAVAYLIPPNEPAVPDEPRVPSPTSQQEVLAEVDLPSDVLGGQFVILENREWTLDEIDHAGDSIPGDFPRTWSAGRLVEIDPETRIVRLKDSESLGYIPYGSLTGEELSAIERIPRLEALKVWDGYDTTPEDIQRALSLPGLKYLATTASVLDAHPLPTNIMALTVSGPPVQWNFPWITAFECDVDYFDTYGREIVPEPLPTNLDNVELLIIAGWPKKQLLPPKVRRLSKWFIEPASLRGANELEWISGNDFEVTGDSGLEVFARFPWLTSLDLSYGAISDAGLEALATATQIEAIELWVNSESRITARGMSALARMPRLRTLELSGAITDTMVMGLSGAPALEELNLSHQAHKIRGSCFEVLSSIPSLRTLDIRGCDNFSGTGARFLNGLSIEVLHEFSWNVTDEGCREIIANWPSPTLSFWLCCGHLTDAAFDGLEKAQGLRSLDLSACDRITSVTLSRVLRLTQLESLVLPGVADLDDEYLASLCSLTELKLLSINHAESVTELGLLQIVRLPYVETLRIDCEGVNSNVLKVLQECRALRTLQLPTYYSWDDQYEAAWQFINARPDVHVYAVNKGNPYDPSEHPTVRAASKKR